MYLLRTTKVVSIVLMLAGGLATAQAETQTFDDAASAATAGWIGVQNQNGTIGTNYGFSNTNNAGGTDGEAGGVAPERLNGVISYYADTDLADTLSQKNTLLSASGRIRLNSVFTDGGFRVGWFNATTAAGYQDCLGLGIAGGGGGTRWGGQAVFTGYAGYWGPDENAWGLLTAGNDYMFYMNYDPTGVDATHGELTVELRNAGDNSLVGITTTSGILSGEGDHTMTLDGFGIVANYSGSDPGGNYEFYVDDLSYGTGVITPPPLPTPQPPTIVVPSGNESFNGSLYLPGTTTATEPIRLKAGPQLWIDDFLIKNSTGLTRRVNSPVRDPQAPNPLITGGAAGDANISPYMTVIRDPQTEEFRIWYNTYKELPTGGYQAVLATMESPDGINWVRPYLNSNVITFGASVIDEGPDCPDPAKRYKLGWWGDPGDAPADYGMTIGYSADGTTWTKLTPKAFLNSTHDINSIFWDPERERYIVNFTAGAWGPPGGPTWTGNRRVGLMTTSTDLINWEQPYYVLTPDDSVEPGETQFYGMSGFVFRGDLIVGLAKVLHDDWKASDTPAGAYGVGYTSLVWSRDGVHWTRDPAVYFEGDPDPNAWDHAHAWGDFQLEMGDETYIYYGGYQYGHKYDAANSRDIGMIKMQRDRYVSRDAGAEGGTLLTPLLVTTAKGITINASVDGELKIRVLDENGQPLPGFDWSDFTPINGDSLSHPACWEGDFASLKETPIQLEFSLVNGQMYGFTLMPSYIAGDANGDGTVDAADAAVLAAYWQTPTGATWEMGDFDGDGDVDDADATLLAANWQGSSLGDGAAPEPCGLLMFLGAFLTCAALRYRR